MIEEITNFVTTIPDEYQTEGLTPSDGLHILIELDENNHPIGDNYMSILIQNGKAYDVNQEGELEEIQYQYDFAKREYYSKWISSNKAVDFSRKIHSTSPYVIAFKTKKPGSIPSDQWKEYSRSKKLENTAEKRIDYYFNKLLDNEEIDEEEISIISKIYEFSRNELFEIIKKDRLFTLKDNNENFVLSENKYVKIYFKVDMKLLKNGYERYLKDKIFNKNEYNTKDNNYGLSNFLNGSNQKKQFMLHQTSFYKVNNRIHYKEGILLEQFKKLLDSRRLPNPVPIFIDQTELNTHLVKIYSRDGVLNFREVIHRLFKEHQVDLYNYYLINWSKTRNGLQVNDFDFVPRFRYTLQDVVLKNVMQIKLKDGNSREDRIILNIFDFETLVLTRLFNNSLVQKTRQGDIHFRYFDEIDPKYISKTTYQNLLRYRKSWYDYIYKSKTDAISKRVFYNLFMSSIRDSIKNTDDFSDTYEIKDKLNMLFSLNSHFDRSNSNFGGIDMRSQIPVFRKDLSLMLEKGSGADRHLDSDEQFAFAAGQLIYYILAQSESSNKTHALLEPYISKSEPDLFKTTISRGIEQYKHALQFGHRKFQKLAAEVLGYNCEKSIKELIPTILAGYFSDNLLFQKSTQTNQEEKGE